MPKAFGPYMLLLQRTAATNPVHKYVAKHKRFTHPDDD